MAQITQLGATNTNALSVPDLYVQIVPPQNLLINGVPTNVLGIVGTATWGPVNQATIVGTTANYAFAFGQYQNRKYDMGTAVYIAAQQGANAFRCVRVTDGTDTAATATVLTNCLTLTALWTGSQGNNIQVTLLAGSKNGTTAVQVVVPGIASERFDNIAGTGNALWAAIAAALTSGVGTTRSASAWVTAVAGAGTTAPTLGSATTLSGGTDGTTTITAATLIGQDTIPRKGMYALRSQGCSVGMLADADDSTQWVTQGAFGLSEGVYMILTAPAGTAIANGTTGTVDLKAAAGLDTYAAKLMHGDWIWWFDQVNVLYRYVSPQPFVAGELANLAPQNSTLNKPINGVVASQKSGSLGTTFASYAAADLAALFQAGIDVIANPQPGGSYWGARRGCNSSSNPSVNGDNYTRLTNFIASSVAAVFGQFVGQVITPDLFQKIAAALNSFFSNMAQQGQIGNPAGTKPWAVVCNLTNNPASRTSLGYLQADCTVQYGPILLFLICNIQGGQTVVVATVTSGGVTVA